MRLYCTTILLAAALLLITLVALLPGCVMDGGPQDGEPTTMPTTHPTRFDARTALHDSRVDQVISLTPWAMIGAAFLVGLRMLFPKRKQPTPLPAPLTPSAFASPLAPRSDTT